MWLSVIEYDTPPVIQWQRKLWSLPSAKFPLLSLHLLIIILTRKWSTDLDNFNFFHLRFTGLIFTISMIPIEVYTEYKNTLPTVTHNQDDNSRRTSYEGKKNILIMCFRSIGAGQTKYGLQGETALTMNYIAHWVWNNMDKGNMYQPSKVLRYNIMSYFQNS